MEMGAEHLEETVTKRDFLGCRGCAGSAWVPTPLPSGERDECPPTDPTFHVRVSQGRISAVREMVSYTCVPNSRVGFDPHPQLPNTILYLPSVNVQRI